MAMLMMSIVDSLSGVKVFENIGANLCIWWNLITSGHQKQEGKPMLLQPTFKSGIEFTISVI